MIEIGSEVDGKYKILRLIGEGGMGKVYLAEQAALDRKVAIKVLHPTWSADSAAAHRFLREARLAARVSDPGVLEIVDVGQLASGSVYMVMEYLEGTSLGEFLASRGVLETAVAVGIAREIARSIAVAHDSGIVHRDLKPSNVFLVANEREALGVRVKVLDFGIATANEVGAESTKTGAVLGSPVYLSPEQAQGLRGIGSAADIYSLGCVLFEMLTGSAPFRAETMHGLLFAHINNAPPEPTKLNPQVPKALNKLVLTMLAKRAEDRPPTMDAVVAELDALHLTRRRIRLDAKPAKDLSLEGNASAGAAGPTTGGTTHGPAGTRAISITRVEEKATPSAFFGNTMAKLLYFKDEEVRLDKIKETFSFYRDHLSAEYNELTRQMKTAHTLWLLCVGAGFLLLITGLGFLLFTAQPKPGAWATAASSPLAYFIGRTLQKREDHYRELRAEKNKNLEYGNDWLLLIQTIDAILDPSAKMDHQRRLVGVLTDKLDGVRQASAARSATIAKSRAKSEAPTAAKR